MGRTITPTFVIDYRDQLGWHWAVWNSKTAGAPTVENLEKWRKAMNASMKPGGCNEHLSQDHCGMPHISEAKVRNQKTGNLKVAYTKAPMFEEV